MSKSGTKKSTTPRGKLIYHSRVEERKRIGDNPTDFVEKSVTHSEDGIFAKLYEKKNGAVTKTTVKAGPTGGEYVFTVRVGTDEAKVSTLSKKDLLSKLKTDKNLDFIVDYVSKEKSLARAKSKSKKANSKKSGSKKKADSKKSKSKSKSKKTAKRK